MLDAMRKAVSNRWDTPEVFSDNGAQTGGMDLPSVMIVLVIAGVVGFVGLQVMSTVIGTTGLSEGDPLYNSSESLEAAVNDAWGLVGVAFIVIILAVIIVYLYGLRGGR
jgi:hypothetical protein